jgi:hypothetical protein
MAQVKISDLSGAALDWMVCMALGMKPEDIYISHMGAKYTSLFRRNRDEDGTLDGTYTTGPDLLFCRKWEAGGPIIEREFICADRLLGGLWLAAKRNDEGDSFLCDGHGPTVLIAAMRCFVASKLGYVVDVPEELL